MPAPRKNGSRRRRVEVEFQPIRRDVTVGNRRPSKNEAMLWGLGGGVLV
jgi:hypothetical protein